MEKKENFKLMGDSVMVRMNKLIMLVAPRANALCPHAHDNPAVNHKRKRIAHYLEAHPRLLAQLERKRHRPTVRREEAPVDHGENKAFVVASMKRSLWCSDLTMKSNCSCSRNTACGV